MRTPATHARLARDARHVGRATRDDDDCGRSDGEATTTSAATTREDDARDDGPRAPRVTDATRLAMY